MTTSTSTGTVLSASAFINSIGVNTKVGYGLYGYSNLSLVENDLQYLGVTHLRDSLGTSSAVQPVLNGLAEAGYKFDFFAGSTTPSLGATGLSQYITQLSAFEQANPGSIAAIEGLNEANLSNFSYNGSSSMTAAAQFQQALYAAVKAAPELSSLSVYNLTLGNNNESAFLSAYNSLPNLSASSNDANAHVYVATNASINATIENWISLADARSTGNPTVITETGYTTVAVSSSNAASTTSNVAVNQDVQAKSIINTVLDAFKDGVSMTYIHQLLDSNSSASDTNPEDHFGLFNADGTPKLAATAIHNLTTILGDSGTGNEMPTAPLGYTLGNLPSSGNSMVLAKSNGAYDLVVWAEPTMWNNQTGQEITNPTQTVAVHLSSVHQTVTIYDPLSGTTPIATYTNVQDFTLPISDHALIIEIDAPATAAQPSPPAATSFSGTASVVVADLATLNASAGLQSITLTDTHVLAVASVSTMNYIIANYQHALSAIQGGYSFSVTTASVTPTASTWSQTITYNPAGIVVSTEISRYLNNVITSQTTTYADGSTDTLSFSAGIKASEVTIKAGVTKTDLFNAAGQVTEEIVQNGQGATNTTFYTNGVATKVNVLNADKSQDNYFYNIQGQSYTSEHIQINAAGTIVSDTRTHADGSLAYTMVIQSDGSKVTDLYSATGVKTTEIKVAGSTVTTDLFNAAGQITEEIVQNGNGVTNTTLYTNGAATKMNVLNADKSQDNYFYNVQGQTYTSEHNHVNAAGTVVSDTRTHADGSLAYTMTIQSNGSKITDLYDATGILTQQTVQQTSGATTNTLYTNGVAMKMYVINADKSQDNYFYNIQGQSYTSEHIQVNASGTIVADTRTHADGSLAYTTAIQSNGSKITDLYDATGVKTTEIKVLGTTVTTDLFNSAGQTTEEIVQNGNGATHTTLYTNGVASKMSVVNADKSQDNYFYNVQGQSYTGEHIQVNAAGTIVSDTRTHTDGSLAYTMAIQSDGTKVTDLYDTTGSMTQQTVQQTSGAKDVYQFVISGSPGASEHDVYNTAGSLTLADRTLGNGTHNVTVLSSGLTVSLSNGDTLNTSAGSTTIMFKGGSDQITGFHAGTANNHDLIEISKSLASDFSHLQFTQSGSNTLVHIDANDSMLLKGIKVASIDHSNFLFV